ncbi:hypothetical protein OAJ42_00525 [Flavobacteriales bacterium]|nr:hypothetical protein [Flavobacteriales bacterium]MDC0189350.1 hypothetical protein [Flavobacteriales bacterium]
MKKILLLFIPLTFFFSCDPDDESENTSYNCIGDECFTANEGDGQYNTLTECLIVCGNENISYNCINNECYSADGGSGQYATLDDCLNNCDCPNVGCGLENVYAVDTVLNDVIILPYSGYYNNDCECVSLGCTDPNACNFREEFTIDDGSCVYTGDMMLPPTTIIGFDPEDFGGVTTDVSIVVHPGCELITQACQCCRDYDDIDEYPMQLQFYEYSCEEAVNLYGCDYLFGDEGVPLGAFCQSTCYGCVFDIKDTVTFTYIDMVSASITNYLQINYDSLNAHLGTNYTSPYQMNLK